jgi:ribonuclease HII
MTISTALHPLSRRHFEDTARQQGFQNIAGGDEAGRGPWAGPVCAAMVILPRDYALPGLDDSKKLSRPQRRTLFELISAQAITFGVGLAEPDEIDAINILEATRLAFQRAFEQLSPRPDYVLLDFIKLSWLTLPSLSMAKGESQSDSIAAASILAKETRDRIMEAYDREYPEYGFGRHMGYGTAFHQAALRKHGTCPIHRRSFKPIKKLPAP